MTQQLQQWAADLVAAQVPFVPQGRDRSGLDCWGVVYLAYRELLNHPLPSYTESYTREDLKNYGHLGDLISSHLPGWEKVEVGQPFDVVLMRLRGRPIHVGLVTRKGHMLHIEEDISVCEEEYGSTIWKNRIIGIYRPRSG